MSIRRAWATVREAMKSPDAKVQKRATALHLLHWGYTPSAVAAMLAVRPGTIHNWIARWTRAGEAGLADRGGRGRKRKATAAYRAALEAALGREPHEVGYAFAMLDRRAVAGPLDPRHRHHPVAGARAGLAEGARLCVASSQA
jgi:hypothetical protein